MKFEQNWLSGFRGSRLKMLMDGRTDGRKDALMHGRTDGRTDNGRKVITIAHPEQSSGELKSGNRPLRPNLCKSFMMPCFQVVS